MIRVGFTGTQQRMTLYQRSAFVHPYKRSWKAQATLDVVLPEKEMLKRNDDLVVFDYLIAAPAEETEQLRSGTWATIRRGEKHGTAIFYVWPTGSVTEARPLDG